MRYHRKYKKKLESKKGNKQHWWGSRQVRDLFGLIGRPEVYEDYQLFSSVAHGRAPNFVVKGGDFDIFASRYGPSLLAVANGYLLEITYCWNDESGNTPNKDLAKLAKQVTENRENAGLHTG